jgi:ligand-binding SRPBCC domain-containing protein
MPHRLERTQVVPRPLEQVFEFFARAENLETITPPFLRFAFAGAPPSEMRPGLTISYRLSLFGLPVRWTSLIEIYEPQVRFVDRQTHGPYKLWRHLHEFRAVPGGTEVRDQVDYELPLGPLGQVAHALFVRRTLDRIFAYRREMITRHL